MIPLTLVVHGESGVGKSWLADTAPAPRLILDAEGGTKFTPSKKVYWDPKKTATPPETKDTCTVYIRDFQSLGHVYNYLQAGKHPFKSVVIDSLTEVQKRCLDNITGVEQARQQDWGELLRKMEGLVRAFRDLTMNGSAIETVTFLAGTQMKDGVMRPHLQGQLGLTLPYYMDVVGYLHLGMGDDGQLVRKLQVTPVQGFNCKDRTGRLGYEVVSPNITSMLSMINEEG